MTWQGVNTKDLAGGSGDFHQGLWSRKGLIFLSWTHKRKPRGTPYKPLMSLVSRSLWSYGKKFNSVAQSCPTLCDPMDSRVTGFPVHHQLPEFTRTHVHWVSDAVQPSHPLSSPSPPAFSLSQHQGPFKWVNSSHQVAKVLEFQLQYSNEYSGLISFRMDWLDLLAVQGTLKSLL